jgi:hypothetical protein
VFAVDTTHGSLLDADDSDTDDDGPSGASAASLPPPQLKQPPTALLHNILSLQPNSLQHPHRAAGFSSSSTGERRAKFIYSISSVVCYAKLSRQVAPATVYSALAGGDRGVACERVEDKLITLPNDRGKSIQSATRFLIEPRVSYATVEFDLWRFSVGCIFNLLVRLLCQ